MAKCDDDDECDERESVMLARVAHVSKFKVSYEVCQYFVVALSIPMLMYVAELCLKIRRGSSDTETIIKIPEKNFRDE